MQQKTIRKEVVIEGIGVHSGEPARVFLRPAACDAGIFFINSKNRSEKIMIGKIIPEEAMHASVIKKNNFIISTIEHLMATVSAFELDNLEIEIDGYEMPILDGSALPFMHFIEEIGVVEQNIKKTFLTVKKPLFIHDVKTDRMIKIIPAKDNDESLYFDYKTDFKHPLVGNGFISGKMSLNFFKEQIAPARTFGFLEQLPFLKSHGLAKGTSLGNTVVVGEEEILNECRFKDEFVRHKLLDLIGDLALLGKNLSGTVIAQKTGHNFNRLVVCDYITNPNNWMIL